MNQSVSMARSSFCYLYLTDDVRAKAREGDLLQELVIAVVHTAADYDMYATGKSNPDNDDYQSSYDYFRELVDKLGIPPQAITDAIDECFPDDPRDNLTECCAASISAG